MLSKLRSLKSRRNSSQIRNRRRRQFAQTLERLENRRLLAADLISLGSAGLGNASSSTASYVSSISSDARYIAFSSSASNLVSGDTNEVSDVFVRDTIDATVIRVSSAADGSEGISSSAAASISANGRYVIFESFADNLVPNDTNGIADLFRKDLATGGIVRVNTANDGSQSSAGVTRYASLSADGNYAVFQSTASDLVSGDSNGVSDVFLKNLASGQVTLVSRDQSGEQGDASSGFPSMSADGRYIAFFSNANNLSPLDQNPSSDIFVKDVVTGSIDVISTSGEGAASDSFSDTPSISSDGRFVAFASAATTLTPGDTNARKDIFVKDRNTGAVVRASINSEGVEGNADSDAPQISGDGRIVVFSSASSNFSTNDSGTNVDIFAKDLSTAEIRRLNVGANTEEANGSSFSPSISSDGLRAVFSSFATNLVAADTNNAIDVFSNSTGFFDSSSLHWQGDVSDNWSDAGNWLEGRVPQDGDTLIFDIGTEGFDLSEGQSTVNDLVGLDLEQLVFRGYFADFSGESFSLAAGIEISEGYVDPQSGGISGFAQIDADVNFVADQSIQTTGQFQSDIRFIRDVNIGSTTLTIGPTSNVPLNVGLESDLLGDGQIIIEERASIGFGSALPSLSYTGALSINSGGFTVPKPGFVTSFESIELGPGTVLDVNTGTGDSDQIELIDLGTPGLMDVMLNGEAMGRFQVNGVVRATAGGGNGVTNLVSIGATGLEGLTISAGPSNDIFEIDLDHLYGDILIEESFPPFIPFPNQNQFIVHGRSGDDDISIVEGNTVFDAVSFNVVPGALLVDNITGHKIALSKLRNLDSVVIDTGLDSINEQISIDDTLAVSGQIDITTASIAINNSLTAPDGIFITADAIDIDTSTGLIDAAASTVTLAPATAALPIDLGSKTPGKLGITAAELNRITAGTLVVGTENSGDLVVSGVLSPSSISALKLVANGSVDYPGGAGAIRVDRLAIQAAEDILLPTSGNQVDEVAFISTGGDINFSNGQSYSVGEVAGVAGVVADGFAILRANSGDLAVQDVRSGADVSANSTVILGSSADESAIVVAAGAVVSGDLVAFQTDEIEMDGSVTASSRVVIPTSDAIDLGSVGRTQQDVLELSAEELSRISAPRLDVGRSTNASITITGPIELDSVNELKLFTAGDVIRTNGFLKVAGLAIDADGDIRFPNLSNLVDTVAFSSGGSINFNNDQSLAVGDVAGISGVVANVAVTLRISSENLIVQDVRAGADVVAGTSAVFASSSDNALATIDAGAAVEGDLIAFQIDDVELFGSVSGDSFVFFDTNDAINLGPLGASLANTLELSNAELNLVTTPELRIGRTTSGSITVSDVIELSSADSLLLRTGGSINGGTTGALVVPELAMRAVGSVDLGNWTLGQSVQSLAAEVLGPGESFYFENDGPLVVGTVLGVDGISTNGGGSTIVANSPLSVVSSILDSNGGSIVLTSANDGDDDDDLTVNATVQTQGGNGNITFNAGTDLTFVGTQPSQISVVGAGTITASVARTAKLNLAVPLVAETTTPTISAAGLAIQGTAQDDTITIDPSDTNDGVQVNSNGNTFAKVVLPPTAPIGASGGAGDDTIIVSSNVTNSTSLAGDAGSDTLQGGGGTNTLAGGNGDDTLVDGGGTNTVIGGSGTNTFVDGGGENSFESGDSEPTDDADTPQLVLQSPLTATEGVARALPVFAALSDPNEQLSIQISSTDIRILLSAGNQTTPGVWELLLADLEGLTVTVPDEGSFSLQVSATSTETDSGETATVTGQVTINGDNSAPDLSIESLELGSESNRASVGQTVTIEGLLQDLGLDDTQIIVVDWGEIRDDAENADADRDVTSITAGGGMPFSLSHEYATGGVFDVTITAADNFGDSVQQVVEVWVSGVRVDPNRNQLQIIGTQDSDFGTVARLNSSLIVVSDLIPSRFWWLPAGKETFDADAVESILVDGSDGNDVFTIFSSVEEPATMLGGDGNDILKAGSGNSTLRGDAGNDWLFGGLRGDLIEGGEGDDHLFGGEGDDLLFGQAGDDRIDGGRGNDIAIGGDGDDRIDGEQGLDLIFGGLGADDLRGGQDDDLLIGGTTSYDDDVESLVALRNAWTSGASYSDRTTAIRSGVLTSSGSLAFLSQDGADRTVYDDDEEDRLKGQSGQDWFFAELATDRILGKRKDEAVG